MKQFAKIGVQGGHKGRSTKATLYELYFWYRMFRGLHRLFRRRRVRVKGPTEKEIRMKTLALLREGIPPGDSLTIVCGGGSHRVVHDRTGHDITALVAFAGQLPLATKGIAMHEYELMRAVVGLLVGDHEFTFAR